jgi:hypothetical protein
MFEVPILFVIFNRPDTTQKVFEKIQQIKPKRLYIAGDGPRPDVNADKELCQKARDLVLNSINWKCDVRYKFEKLNLGCGLGVYSAISWAFEKEDKLIILEDDNVPSIPFFGYCKDLLEFYNNDLRVWVISGFNHFNGNKNLNDKSYFFSHYASIVGWATWKRCWDEYDIFMKDWPNFKESGYKFSHLSSEQGIDRFDRLDRIYQEKILNNINLDAWAFQFSFAIWANSGVGIVPAENLITNIGIEGVHSSSPSLIHNLPASESFKIKKRPAFFQTNYLYDNAYFNLFCRKKSLLKRILKRLVKRWLRLKRNKESSL